MDKKKTKALIILIIIFFATMLYLKWADMQQWDKSLICTFSQSGEKILLDEGRYHLFVYGESEEQVENYRLSGHSGFLFDYLGEPSSQKKLDFSSGTVMQESEGKVYSSIGKFNIEKSGEYLLTEVAESSGLQFAVVDSVYMKLAVASTLVAVFLLIALVGYIFWFIKDWPLVQTFIKNTSGLKFLRVN